MDNDLLFIYGSLLDTGNEFGLYVYSNAQLVCSAVFKGRLFNCGEYPGAITNNEGYDIKGSIYRFNNPDEAFTVLDDYEGFGEEQEQPNLFVRTTIIARCGDDDVKCWVYLYNHPVDGLIEITSGDYPTYVKS